MNNPSTQVETGRDPSTGVTGTDETSSSVTYRNGHTTMRKLEALTIIRETARKAGISEAATVNAQSKVGKREGTRAVNNLIGDACDAEAFSALVEQALGFDVGSVEELEAEEVAAASA